MMKNTYTKLSQKWILALLCCHLVFTGNAQYCSPSSGTCGSAYYISSFSTSGGLSNISNLNSNCGPLPGGTYYYYQGMTHADTAGAVVGFTFTNTPTFPMYYIMWVDWNADGDFVDTGEQVYTSGGSIVGSGVVNGSFNIPITATTGLTRLRIRALSFTGNFNSCGNSSYSGETEDYDFQIVTATPCSGTPAAGIVSASDTNICVSESFLLSNTGGTIGNGISYQWQSAVSGSNSWVSITSTNVGNQTATSDYRLIVSCSNSGASDTSNIITVSMSPFYDCYCVPLTSCAAGYNIQSFSTTGGITNIGNLNSGCDSPVTGHVYYPGQVLTVQRTSTAGFSFTHGSTGPVNYKIWADWNQDGDFMDTLEQVYSNGAVLGANTTVNGSITVPQSADTGYTRLRIRSCSGSFDACSICGPGEVEDYAIHVLDSVPCSGVPLAGTITGSSSSVCLAETFLISAQGFTMGTGLGFQWQSSTSGTNTWSTIPGATNTFLQVSGQSVATDYKLIVTCVNSLLSDTSNILSVGINPFYQCYCIPSMNCNNNYYISSFSTIGGVTNITNNNSGCGNTVNGHTYYSNMTHTAAKGSLVNFYIQNNPTVNLVYRVWADWNRNGDFSDPGEDVYWSQSFIAGGGSISGGFLVPLTADTGMTRIRVKGSSNSTPCGGALGEVEDYNLIVVAPSACAGTPSAGQAQATDSSVCMSQSFTMYATGFTLGSGIIYKWEQSVSGSGIWSPIPGANQSYVTINGQTTGKDYRFIVTCSNSGLSDTSGTVAVIMNALALCTCKPLYSAGCYAGYYNLNDLILPGINGSGILDTSTQCSTNSYANNVGQTPVQLGQGQSYPGIITTPYTIGFSRGYARFWIDFNDDGVFDSLEAVGYQDQITNSPTLFSVTIPPAAVVGNHVMRVRLVYLGAQQAAGYANTIHPCNSYQFGEAHDYSVSVLPTPYCQAPTSLTLNNITSNSSTLSWTSVGGAIEYRLEYDTLGFIPGTGTLLTSSTNSATISGLLPSSTYTAYVRAVCGASDSSSLSLPITFTTPPVNDLPVNAIPLIVNDTCIGALYSNTGASHMVNEPVGDCIGSAGYKSVWFSFTAPPSGFVRIRKPVNNVQGELINARISLYSTTNPAGLSGFNIISCDYKEPTGPSLGLTMYANDLIPGYTYYIAVDVLNAGTSPGRFCLTVYDVDSTMLPTSGNCVTGVNKVNVNSIYTGWMSLVDNTGRLYANVKKISGTGFGYSPAITVNTSGILRQANGQFYLDRNYFIGNGNSQGTYEAELYFRNAELVAFGNYLANLVVTSQTATLCNSTFLVGNGTNSLSIPVVADSVHGVSRLRISTANLGNFYIHTGTSPLVIKNTAFKGNCVSGVNKLEWQSADEYGLLEYQVERSENATEFYSVGSVKAVGDGSRYEYYDSSSIFPTTYYRLKTVTYPDKEEYTSVVKVSCKWPNSFEISAHPNPVTDLLTVEIFGEQETGAMITLLDISGKIIQEVLPSGMQTLTINTTHYPQGIYLLKYTDSKRTTTIRIVK